MPVKTSKSAISKKTTSLKNETFEEKQKRAMEIYRGLKKLYPNAHCELNFKNPLQLLVATILAAQCTDKRVNKITPELFKKYKNAEQFAAANRSELETLIQSTGFYRNKATSILNMAQKVCDEHGGKIPDTMDELVKLPGVGRKTANVILGEAYGKPGITIDTHFGRLSRRFGWTKQTDPVKVEFEIAELVKPKYWTELSQLVIWHGRRRCHARKPACGACAISHICPAFGEGPTDKDIALKLVKQDSDFQ
jgi:endonuclease III